MPVPLIAAGAMKAAPYILQGLSALGGVFGKKKKFMDEQTLRQLYGPAAIGKDTTELANSILNSPYGQQLLAQAAESGQGLQTEMAARAAGAGLDPSSGGQSGSGDFAVSAGTQAQSGLERQTRAGIYQSAMPIAADLVGNRMQVALANQGEQNATPSPWQRIGAAAGQVAASIPAPTPNAVTTPTAAATSQLGMPMMENGMNGPQNSFAPRVTMPQVSPQAPEEFSNRMRGALQPNTRSAGLRRSLVR